MSQVQNQHPRDGRVALGETNLLITDMSTDDSVPVSDCSNTESGGWFVAGTKGGLHTVTGEFTAILVEGEAAAVKAGETIPAARFHHGAKTNIAAYRGALYIENVRLAGQVGQTGPLVYTGRGTFTGPVLIPGDADPNPN